jgi:predicted nuclease of predicted toxin-antitoxin system
MKFLADMGISPQTVAWLEEQGHDAVHLMERGAEQAQDPDVLRVYFDFGSNRESEN